MAKKILITGARGFTGQHACQHFFSRGYCVIPSAREKQIEDSSNYVYCDLTNLADVEKMIMETKPDFILHLAGKNHAGESWQIPLVYMDGNVMGTVNILEASRKYNPDTKILVAGSMLETSLTETQPNHPYGLSKSIQSTVALAWYYLYELSVSVVRPPNLIGPGNSTGVCSLFAKKIVESEETIEQTLTLMVNNSGVKRAFLDVRDAVSIYADLLENDQFGKIYELDGLQTYTLLEIVNQLESLSSCTIEKELLVVNEPHKKPTEDKKQLVLGAKTVSVPCIQNYRLEQSLSDILDYYRKAI